MSSTTHTSQLFKLLRPICVEISREPSTCTIDALRNFMESNDSSDYSMLVEYILFPLQATVTRKNISLKLKIRAVGCMCVLFSKTNVTRFDMFRDIFQHVCFLLSSKEPGKVSSDNSEDSKEVLLNCILGLLDSSTHEVLTCIYNDDFMPSLGHCISLLLDIAVNEKAKHLTIKAIKCIKKFVFISSIEKRNDSREFNEHERLLSTKLASFLPGVSISLSKVITGGINQGQTIIIAALEAWAAHMHIVMNNKLFPGIKLTDSLNEIDQMISQLMEPKEQCSLKRNEQPNADKSLEVKKDKEWFSNTASKLKILIERVSGLAAHSSWKVRLALLEFSNVLLQNCSIALETSVPCLIEIVIGLSSDEYVEVSRRSRTVISELSVLLANNEKTSIIEVVEENLYLHFSSLPRQIRSTDEETKLRILHIIVGYLRLLADNMMSIFSSDYLLKRMSQAFIQVLEFDLSDMRIVEQKTGQDTSTGSFTEIPFGVKLDCIEEVNSCQLMYKKNFKHFRDDKILSAIVKICWYLGRHGNLLLLVDHLLHIFKASSINRKQIVFLINEIIRGSGRDLDLSAQVELSGESLNLVRTCVTLITSEYLSKDIWKLRISNAEHEPQKSSLRKEDLFTLPSSQVLTSFHCVSFSQLNNNVQLLCLLLEGIGIFATVLREHFESVLLEVLYPLMEKLGSRNATVSQVAYWSLGTIAMFCKYDSIEELIARNVDYLINSISLNLRHINLNPDTPAVLNAMLHYGNKDLIPFLEDTLQEVLSLIDYSSDSFLLSLMKVLNSLTVAICKWFPVQMKDKKKESEEVSIKLIKDTDLRDFFIEQLKLKKESLGDVSEDEVELSEDDHSQETPNRDEVKEIPLQIKFIEKILEKCTYFLTSKFVTVRLVTLDTVQHGVLALSSTEDHLLPMLHKLWQPMVKCFSDEELVVRTKAVAVLNVMINTSGQFMRRRVIKDALPVLISYLVKQQRISAKAGAVYTHTLGFKFQLAILNVAGTLCRDLEILDIQCDKVISAILPYLSQEQPLRLQQAAVDTMRILNDLEPDLVWFSLNDLYCPSVPNLPPSSSFFVFPTVQCFGLRSDKNAEYSVNVQKLLADIQT